MNIQNVSSMEQAPQPVRAAKSGTPSTVTVQPRVAVELPRAAASQTAERQPPPEQLKHAVDSVNEAIKQTGNSLEFSVDSDSHRTVVKLVDTETGDVIRQYPSKEMLAISHAIDQFQQGLLLKQKA